MAAILNVPLDVPVPASDISLIALRRTFGPSNFTPVRYGEFMPSFIGNIGQTVQMSSFRGKYLPDVSINYMYSKFISQTPYESVHTTFDCNVPFQFLRARYEQVNIGASRFVVSNTYNAVLQTAIINNFTYPILNNSNIATPNFIINTTSSVTVVVKKRNGLLRTVALPSVVAEKFTVPMTMTLSLPPVTVTPTHHHHHAHGWHHHHTNNLHHGHQPCDRYNHYANHDHTGWDHAWGGPCGRDLHMHAHNWHGHNGHYLASHGCHYTGGNGCYHGHHHKNNTHHSHGPVAHTTHTTGPVHHGNWESQGWAGCHHTNPIHHGHNGGGNGCHGHNYHNPTGYVARPWHTTGGCHHHGHHHKFQKMHAPAITATAVLSQQSDMTNDAIVSFFNATIVLDGSSTCNPTDSYTKYNGCKNVYRLQITLPWTSTNNVLRSAAREVAGSDDHANILGT